MNSWYPKDNSIADVLVPYTPQPKEDVETDICGKGQGDGLPRTNDLDFAQDLLNTIKYQNRAISEMIYRLDKLEKEEV